MERQGVAREVAHDLRDFGWGNAIFAMFHQNTKNLWRGNLHVDELLDLPMFSYKNLSLEEMYEGGSYQNNLKWSEELHHKLSQHSNPTPRTALGL